MGHTRPWSDTTPADDIDSDTIVPNVRTVKQDIKERMEDFLGVGALSNDPVVTLSGRTRIFHHTLGRIYSGTPGYGTGGSIYSCVLWIPMPLPVGAVLTEVAAVFYTDAAGSATNSQLQVFKEVWDGTLMTQTTLSTIIAINATAAWVSATDTPAYTAGADDLLFATATIGASPYLFSHIKATFTLPDGFRY